MSGRAVHLAVGPDRHGVVRHVVEVAAACGDPCVRVATVDEAVAHDWSDTAVVHVGFTDHLFGRTHQEAVTAFARLAAVVRDAGATLSVTVHDVPFGDTALQRARTISYRAVVAAAHGVVVNSRLELALLGELPRSVHSARVVPLPVAGPVRERRPPDAPTADVGVLGFVFPDRGYDDVLAALPDGARLVAVGGVAAGHQDLADRYATEAGTRWCVAGFIEDADLPARLAAVTVPVAPNPRVTASASIRTWWSHGRRPLVPDSPHTRELVADHPGLLTVYRGRDELAAALAAALAEPAGTWLAESERPVSTWPAVVGGYTRHLAGCRPPRAVTLAAGRVAVPGNRWDLVPTVVEPLRVSVVIPYYEAQTQLDRVLVGLRSQVGVDAEIVVVDDGSAVAPDVTAAGELPCRVLRQDDRGFRAARARNLGAAAATGSVLAFLDGDTVPEPDYLRRLVALPAAAPDVVAVGRRRHADLAGDGTELPAPRWLTDAYRDSHDLLDVNRRSYRFVISAVIALDADLYARIGGFDERFVGYGGEDWDLAHRLYVAGAVFAHVPQAVAWHDGPDWAGRPVGDRRAVKDAETFALAHLLPDPDARGGGSWWPYPAVVVRAGSLTAAAALATARTAFAAGLDGRFFLDAVTGPGVELLLADPRVQVGSPSSDVLARAPFQLSLHQATDLSGVAALFDAADRHGEVRAPGFTLRSTRAVRRAQRWAEVGVDDGWWFGGRDVVGEAAGFGDAGLARVLARTQRASD